MGLELREGGRVGEVRSRGHGGQIPRASGPGSFGLPSKCDGDPPEKDRTGTAFEIRVTKGDIVLLEVPSGCSRENDTRLGTRAGDNESGDGGPGGVTWPRVAAWRWREVAVGVNFESWSRSIVR